MQCRQTVIKPQIGHLPMGHIKAACGSWAANARCGAVTPRKIVDRCRYTTRVVLSTHILLFIAVGPPYIHTRRANSDTKHKPAMQSGSWQPTMQGAWSPQIRQSSTTQGHASDYCHSCAGPQRPRLAHQNNPIHASCSNTHCLHTGRMFTCVLASHTIHSSSDCTRLQEL